MNMVPGTIRNIFTHSVISVKDSVLVYMYVYQTNQSIAKLLDERTITIRAATVNRIIRLSYRLVHIRI